MEVCSVQGRVGVLGDAVPAVVEVFLGGERSAAGSGDAAGDFPGLGIVAVGDGAVGGTGGEGGGAGEAILRIPSVGPLAIAGLIAIEIIGRGGAGGRDVMFGGEQAAAVGGDDFPTLCGGIIESNFAPKVGPLAGGGEVVHGDILARRGFTVNVHLFWNFFIRTWLRFDFINMN